LGSQQQALQNQLAQQQQQLQSQQQQAQQAQQQAASIYQQPPGFGGSPFTNQSAAMQKVQQQQEEEIKRAMQTGDTSRLSPQMRQQFEQAQQQAGLSQYPDGRWFNANRREQLEKLYPDSDTPERIQEREKRHDDIAAQKKIERREAHVDALMRGGSEESVKRKLEHEFGEHGKAVGNGTADGIKNSSGQAKSGVADMINGLIDESKKRLAISSPSKVFAGIGGDTVGGLAGGMSSAVAGASATVAGVASDRGLMIGYRWATSMVTGIQSVFKASDFQANAVPQIQNDQAKSVLGQLGLLGPAGSGASIYKTAMVAIGGSTTSSSLSNLPAYNLTINLDGQPFRNLVVNQNTALVNAVADAISSQVG
jgi:type IV secretory pathway VirB2 component (pilin)